MKLAIHTGNHGLGTINNKGNSSGRPFPGRWRANWDLYNRAKPDPLISSTSAAQSLLIQPGCWVSHQFHGKPGSAGFCFAKSSDSFGSCFWNFKKKSKLCVHIQMNIHYKWWKRNRICSFQHCTRVSFLAVISYLGLSCFVSKNTGYWVEFEFQIKSKFYCVCVCVCVCVVSHFSCVQLFVTLWTVAHQAPLSMGFSK